MKRQIVMVGDSLVIDPGGSVNPGTSDYPWANTPTRQLFEVWNNPEPVPNEFGYNWPGSSVGSEMAVGFAVAPTLVIFNKVTIEAGVDYSQTGANTWWFPPNNAHGPGASIILRKRDLTTWLEGTGTATKTFVAADDNNVNINAGPPPYKLAPLKWELASHPEGGPWTLEDLNDLAIGIRYLSAPGPNGKAFDVVAGSFFKIRVPFLKVTLDVEDLGGFVDAQRHGSSLILRLMRRARNVVKPIVMADKAAGDIGSVVYMSHPQAPAIGGKGWGRRGTERRAGQVMTRAYLPESFQVSDEVHDREAYRCLWWAAYRIDGPWSPELLGLALLDKGKGFIHDRDQESWSRRPGDGVLMRVLPDYPNLSREGLAMAGGGDVAICPQNFSLTAPGWATVGASGEFTVAEDPAVHMAEEQGYLTSARLTYGAGGGMGARERSVGALPRTGGNRLHVRVIVKNSSVPDPVTDFIEVLVKRSGGGLAAPEQWDYIARAWTTAAAVARVPSDEPSGELVLDAIPLDAPSATSDPTYSIGVGRYSSAIGPATFHGAIVDVQQTDGTVAGARPSIVTLDAPIVRLADSHKLPNRWGRELWAPGQGVAVVEARPWSRFVDLPADAVKPLLHAQHAPFTWDALQVVAKAGADDVVRFERGLDGQPTFRLDCPIVGVDLTRDHVLRAWARWLSVEGWRDFGPWSVEVGAAVFLASDGSLVWEGSKVGRFALEMFPAYARDYLGVGCDESGRQADADIRMGETRRNPIHRLEAVWRI